MRKEFLRIKNGIKKGERGEKLRNFDLIAYEGEITLILASRVLEIECLSRLLAGNDDFSYGTVYYRGEKVSAYGEMGVLRDKIVRIAENDGLIDGLNIADNLFVVNGRSFWREPLFVQEKKNVRAISMLLEQFGLHFAPQQKVAWLSHLQRYQVCLLKLFCSGIRAVLLDQRLMHLVEQEKQELYELICRLRERGMTFLVLDYVLPEMLSQVDAVWGVWQATTVFSCETARMSEDRRDMIMQALRPGMTTNPYMPCAEDAPEVFTLYRVSGMGLPEISLHLHRGEVAFIESGSYEVEQVLYDILCGNSRPEQGEIWITGKRTRTFSREQRTQAGVIGINRVEAETGEFSNLTVFDNYCMCKGQKIRELWWRPAYRQYLRRELEQLFGRKVADEPLYALAPVELQKLQFHACMLTRPKVLVCLSPFTNVDAETGREAEMLIQQTASLGIAVLVLSRGQRYDCTGGAVQYLLNETGLHRQN